MGLLSKRLSRETDAEGVFVTGFPKEYRQVKAFEEMVAAKVDKENVHLPCTDEKDYALLLNYTKEILY